MTLDEIKELAIKYAWDNYKFDIVAYAGEEDGWHYFSMTCDGRPKYSNMPLVLRIGSNGDTETIVDLIIRNHISVAHKELLCP